MSPRPASRTQPCTRENALARLAQAETFIRAAELVLEDATDVASPGVAAALCVLSGIAASDAACCSRLKKRPRGPDHREAMRLLATIVPNGVEMAKDLRRLLDRKDDAHYGFAFVGQDDAARMLRWAERLTLNARRAVET